MTEMLDGGGGRPSSILPGESPGTDGYVEFVTAGAAATGEFLCVQCGYGVIVQRRRTLPVCPMCGGRSWERGEWSPLTRARRQAPLV